MHLQELDAHRRVIRTRSGEISYIDIGTGPVALFVHGIATSAFLWRNVIEALTTHRRCIALDLPMHGQTPVTAEQDLSVPPIPAGLDEFCDTLGPATTSLVAEPAAAASALLFSCRYPPR